MALGLFWLVAKWANPNGKDIDDLKKYGLYEFYLNLDKNPWITVLERRNTLTALEALEKGEGDCGEISKILFAVFSMAGLDPQFVFVNLIQKNVLGVWSKGSQSGLIEQKDYFTDHLCLGLEVGGRLRLFDAAQNNTDAQYSEHYPLTLRQSLAGYYEQIGVVTNDKAVSQSYFEKALLIDPDDIRTHHALGYALFDNDPDQALYHFTQVINLFPSYSPAYIGRAGLWFKKGNVGKAIKDLAQSVKLEELDDITLDEIYGAIVVYACEKWRHDPIYAHVAEVFENIGGLNIEGVEIQFLKAAILWEAGKEDKARDKIKDIFSGFDPDAQTSSNFAKYLKEIVNHLPVDMLKDKAVWKEVSVVAKIADN